jgi:CRISPR-associated protein Cas1
MGCVRRLARKGVYKESHYSEQKLPMATLYITQQGATLRKEQNRLVVEYDGRVLASLHDFKIERVVVFGNVQLTTQTMELLMDRGIDTTFVSVSGRLRGRLAPIPSKNVMLRCAQYERSRDRAFSLKVARAIVVGKISNCIQVLARYQRHRPETSINIEKAELARLQGKVEEVHTLDSLRGVEGQAASIYFQCFGRLLSKGFHFEKRTRRPPRDPVNAMLGFGYALLHNEAISAATACGFDPYVGFYHSISYGRCSLALDLMEEMRPLLVDRLVLYLANTETVSPGQFSIQQDGVRMEAEARKRFLRAYEEMINSEFIDRAVGGQTSLRVALYDQAQILAKSVTDGTSYRPFQGWQG